MADPYKHASPHICYCAKFGQSMSNHMGVDTSQKLGMLGTHPLGWGVRDPPGACAMSMPLPRVTFGWSGKMIRANLFRSTGIIWPLTSSLPRSLEVTEINTD